MRLPRIDTKVVGSKIVFLDVVDSTNDRAWLEALNGAPDGTVVLAQEQTKGRGRLGRPWCAPKGSCVLLSAVLRPKLDARRAPLVTALGALAAVEAARIAAGVETKIRFPNDVMAGPKKLAGVLVESRFISSVPDLFVVGIGLNVNVSEWPEDLRTIATSLCQETGIKWDVPRVAAALVAALDDWYGRLETGDIERAWKERSAVMGRRVEVREAGRTLQGRVDDLDVLAGITLRLDSGLVAQVRGEYVEQLREI